MYTFLGTLSSGELVEIISDFIDVTSDLIKIISDFINAISDSIEYILEPNSTFISTISAVNFENSLLIIFVVSSSAACPDNLIIIFYLDILNQSWIAAVVIEEKSKIGVSTVKNIYTLHMIEDYYQDMLRRNLIRKFFEVKRAYSRNKGGVGLKDALDRV
jgi:hypothetical protein